MLFCLYFSLNAFEAFLLAFFMVYIGSSAQESVFLNLSLSRLIIVLTIFLIGLLFLYLAVRSRIEGKKLKALEEKFLSGESGLWVVFGISISLVCFALFVLTRQLDSFGNLKLIYLRVEPILVWMVVFGAQSAFFLAIWYSVHFIDRENRHDIRKPQRELLPLLGIYAVFVILKVVFVTAKSYGPVGSGDDMTYFEMADAFYHGIFSPRDSNYYQYPLLYPLSLVATLTFKSWTFGAIKLLNNLFSTSIIFPAYFISRRFLDARKSLITALLSCLIPFHLVFPSRIVSENLYFPLFLWTMFITFVIPENKKFRLLWDLLNGIMIAILYLTRYITLAVIPFFILAWWIKPFDGEKSLFNPGLKKLFHFFLLAAAMLATFSPWPIMGIKTGVPLNLMLGFGIAAKTTAAQLTISKLLIWVVLYACYFILVAAPVLHLLIASLWQIDLKNWRSGFNRWVIQVLAIMAGFFAAVTRHSWRAYYNREIPSAIMGRYLIIFSVLFFTISLVTLVKFEPSRFKTMWKYFAFTQIFSFGLVVFAYITLINGAVIHTDGNLLKMQGSLDGFYIDLLGPYFFVLLFFNYGLTNLLLWKEKKQTALTALVIGIAIYYTVGAPAYFKALNDNQTYPWLAKQISQLLPQADQKSGDAVKITVYLPPDSTSHNGTEIYSGLRTRGFENISVEEYSVEAVKNLKTEKGFVIEKLDGKQSLQGLPVYEFNNQQFVIIPVQK